MKGIKNLSKKSARPARSATVNQRHTMKITKISFESIYSTGEKVIDLNSVVCCMI